MGLPEGKERSRGCEKNNEGLEWWWGGAGKAMTGDAHKHVVEYG